MQQSTLPPFEVGLGKLRECTFMGAMGCEWLGSNTGGAHSNQLKDSYGKWSTQVSFLCGNKSRIRVRLLGA